MQHRPPRPRILGARLQPCCRQPRGPLHPPALARRPRRCGAAAGQLPHLASGRSPPPHQGTGGRGRRPRPWRRCARTHSLRHAGGVAVLRVRGRQGAFGCSSRALHGSRPQAGSRWLVCHANTRCALVSCSPPSSMALTSPARKLALILRTAPGVGCLHEAARRGAHQWLGVRDAPCPAPHARIAGPHGGACRCCWLAPPSRPRCAVRGSGGGGTGV